MACFIRVSIPQAVSTVATEMVTEYVGGHYLVFQYRKR